MSTTLPRFVCTAIAAILALSAGCSKNSEPAAATPPVAVAPKPVTIEVVKESERSRNFLAVSRQLELGGTLYGYVDVDGDALRLAGDLKSTLQYFGKAQPQFAAFANQDFPALVMMLGLTDITAAGVSSVPEGNGYFRNRTFFYIPGERHGLLAGLGGKAGSFTHLNLAPADAAVYTEAEMDLPVVYRTLKQIVAKVGGDTTSNQLETSLQKAGDAITLSVLDLIYGLKGRFAVVLRADAVKTMRLPGQPGVVLPALSFLVCVDGIAPVVEPALAKAKNIRRTDTGTLHVYEVTEKLPIEEIRPVLVADGTTLYLASTREFYDECRSQKTGLAQTPEFQAALAKVGTEGNGLTYVSPRFFEQVRRVATLNPNLPVETKPSVDFVLARLPVATQPLVSVRTNLPDGVLVRSYWNSSLKKDVAMISVYNPMTVGLLAAMAIPAFQKVRVASQEKAVLNNLRQLDAAADQYYLETGKTTATYDDLVGPNHYVKVLNPVVGENYRRLRFVQGQPLRIAMPDGRVIQFPPAPSR